MSEWSPVGNGFYRLKPIVLTADTATLDTGANAIPAGYNVLEIFAYIRTDESATFSAFGLRFNGDGTGNYDLNQISNTNTSVSGTSSAAQSAISGACAAANDTASVMSPVTVAVPAYSSAAGFKAGTMVSGRPDETVANMNTRVTAFSWRSTAAINQATLVITSGSGQKFKAGSALYVYVR